tara:strand:+ start:330 stop:524 length:195 start_codon:yes stop_codon:yes gene_type:complete
VLNKKEVFTIYLKFYEKSILKTFNFKKIAGIFPRKGSQPIGLERRNRAVKYLVNIKRTYLHSFL